MQVSKFEGSDMREALGRVKAALGPDALIVATRSLKGGGLFGPARIEVSAAPAESTTTQKNQAVGLGGRVKELHLELMNIGPKLNTSEGGSGDERVRRQLSELRLLLDQWVRDGGGDLTAALEAGDLDQTVVHRLAKDVEARLERNAGHGEHRALTDSLHDLFGARNYTPGARILALMGPTGVGKTTSLAKLAARSRLGRGERVGLICLDNYRIGGVEQLQVYADLIDVPLITASDAASFKRALDRMSSMDRIFVDTAGRSPHDVEQIALMRRLFGPVRSVANVEVHLCIDAATRRLELTRLLDRFSSVGPSTLLMTKLDEAVSLGAVVNATERTDLPISYITFGQRVPEDMASASNAWLARETGSRLIDPSGFVRDVVWPPNFGDEMGDWV